MEILQDLIGEKLAEECIAEIKDRSRPDDPDYFQQELRNTIIQKYISKKEITFTELSSFLDKHESQLRLDTARNITDLIKAVKQMIAFTIAEIIRQENDAG